MRISWDAFETYCTCPQWLSWQQVKKPSGFVGSKDTQYLVRGNVIQALFEKIVGDRQFWDHGWGDFAKEVINANIRAFITREILAQQALGSPKITALDLELDISETLQRNLIGFQLNVVHQVGIAPRVFSQMDVKAPYKEHELQARIDIAVAGQGKIVIYEGKATKYPERVKEDQLRWQAQILFDNPPEQFVIAPQHFYILYTPATIRAVPIFEQSADKTLEMDRDQRRWVDNRNAILQRLLAGDWTPTPSSSSCKNCPFQNQCPDKHKPHHGLSAFGTVPKTGLEEFVM